MSLMYAQEMGKISVEPYGDAEMVPMLLSPDFELFSTIGWFGRYGIRCDFLQGEKENGDNSKVCSHSPCS